VPPSAPVSFLHERVDRSKVHGARRGGVSDGGGEMVQGMLMSRVSFIGRIPTVVSSLGHGFYALLWEGWGTMAMS